MRFPDAGAERRRCPQAASSGAYRAALREAVEETLWPTRCAVCDRPGEVLCADCERALPYIDRWQACPVCGAPWGMGECTECNRLSLRDTGYDAFPPDGCASAVLFEGGAPSIVRLCKDAGERRLAQKMAGIIARTVPPEWARGAVVSFVPATRAARRRRGFDHGEALGEAVAAELGAPCAALLERPSARDQRGLTRSERFANLSERFTAVKRPAPPPKVLIVDDVLTTGATLFAASSALKAAGSREVYGATFARVY